MHAYNLVLKQFCCFLVPGDALSKYYLPIFVLPAVVGNILSFLVRFFFRGKVLDFQRVIENGTNNTMPSPISYFMRIVVRT